jgi:CheY-like chemotaxis protein
MTIAILIADKDQDEDRRDPRSDSARLIGRGQDDAEAGALAMDLRSADASTYALKPSPNKRNARVLVLDDDEKRHDWFRDKAEALNWELHQAWTAEEAIESLDRNDFDLVFLDHDLEIGRLKLGAPYNWGPNGTVAARHIAVMVAKPRHVHIHSVNRGGAAGMEKILRAAAVNVTRAEFGNFEVSTHAEGAAITLLLAVITREIR